VRLRDATKLRSRRREEADSHRSRRHPPPYVGGYFPDFRRLLAVSICALALLLLTSCSQPDQSAALTELKCYPSSFELGNGTSGQSVIIEASYADGTTRDVTSETRLWVADSRYARLELMAAETHTNRQPSYVLFPKADGKTSLIARFENRTVEVPVTVSNSTAHNPISFKLDVMPVFMKAGCNAGSCHGTSRGKDGFRLSLFGFDPDGDYYRLTREQIGRRVNLAYPEQSLIVQKGLGAVQHTGGVRFGTNSELCQTLVKWLADGAPKDPPEISKLTGIEIFPTSAIVEGSNAVQHFIVQARYSDGRVRDVTRSAVFLSNNDGCARVGENGTITSGQRGEAFIQARYGEFNVGAPFVVVQRGAPAVWPDITGANYIDQAVYAKLRKLRLAPSDLCDDATFIRRATIDVAGRLPTVEEVRAFVADKEPARRERLLDRLLASKEFADIWVMKWAELLEIRSRDNAVYPKSAELYFEWLRDQLMTNAPLDRIVQELLTASGSNLRHPAANYYQIEPDTLKLAENTAQVFLGMRIQCAQCHNHPFDRWTMNDYYSFAAFFAQTGRKPGDDPRETVIFDRGSGEIKHPVSGAAMHPKFLGGEMPEIKGETRREALAKWITSPENPYFARNIANLVWSHFMGRGIVEPVDDARISNPPSNPELLDALAKRLVEYHYDLKRILGDICASRTYQLSTRANASNGSDERNFSKASIRRIRAEVLLDCISQVTETQDKFNGLPRGAHAVQIADGNTGTYFLKTFGRASRTSVCSCEVKTDPNLSQALHLLNGDTLQTKIEQGGVVKKLLKEGRCRDEIIADLYLRCFSREPTPGELAKLQAFFKDDEKPELVLNDVFWSLLNAKEFVFNH
jgi:hypothetical protein